MFRAVCAHHQEVKIVLYSVWYHRICRWPSGAQVERGSDHNSQHCANRHWHVTFAQAVLLTAQ